MSSSLQFTYHEEPPRVIKISKHAILLNICFILFNKYFHPFLLLFLTKVICRPRYGIVDNSFAKAITADCIYIPWFQLEKSFVVSYTGDHHSCLHSMDLDENSFLICDTGDKVNSEGDTCTEW